MFLDADESEGWIPVVDIDFDRKTIEGAVVQSSDVHRHGDNDWRIRVPKCDGTDLARFFKDILPRIQRLDEEDVSDSIYSAMFGSIRALFSPSEAIKSSLEAEDRYSLFQRIVLNGAEQFWESGLFRIVPSQDRFSRHLSLDSQKEEALLDFFRSCFDVLSVSPIPEEDAEVLQMLGEPHIGFDLGIDPDIDPDDLEDMISRMKLFGPLLSKEDEIVYRWTLPP